MTNEMPGTAITGELPVIAALRALEDEFPGWHCWRSNHGWLWATRCGPKASFAGHIPMTIDAATVDELRRQLTDLTTSANLWAWHLE